MRNLLIRSIASALLCAAPLAPAFATFETPADKAAAADAAQSALADMQSTFGRDALPPGKFLWKSAAGAVGVTRVVVSLSDQLAFAYSGDDLIGVSSISSGTDERPTPTGIFPILDKERMHRSIKYDNAPMPFMQRLDDYGVALHGGNLPGYPASHGCVRLPPQFAAKLFAATAIGTEVVIGDPGAERAIEYTEDTQAGGEDSAALR